MCWQSCRLTPWPPMANCAGVGGNSGTQSKRSRVVALGEIPEPCTKVEEEGA